MSKTCNNGHSPESSSVIDATSFAVEHAINTGLRKENYQKVTVGQHAELKGGSGMLGRLALMLFNARAKSSRPSNPALLEARFEGARGSSFVAIGPQVTGTPPRPLRNSLRRFSSP